MTPDLVFVSGLLSGLAASLHCAGLCGGIAAMLMPALPGGGALSARIRLSFLAKMQAGRAAVYVAAGTAAGSDMAEAGQDGGEQGGRSSGTTSARRR